MEAILIRVREYISDKVLGYLINRIEIDKKNLADLATCGNTASFPSIETLRKRVLGSRNPFYYSASQGVRERYDKLRKVTGELVKDYFSG